MPDGREITLPLQAHPVYGLLIMPIQIGDDIFSMFISGSPFSGLADTAWGQLLLSEDLVLPSEPGGRYRLDRLSLDGVSLAPLEVRLSRRAHRFGLDGELGLNFFRQFARVTYEIPEEQNQPVLLVLEQR